MDQTATIQKLKNQIQKFCQERDWDQFHNPKDLAIGMSTEATSCWIFSGSSPMPR